MKFKEDLNKIGKTTRNLVSAGLLISTSALVLDSNQASAQNVERTGIQLESVIKNEFEEGKEFMTNWFSNRILDDDVQKEFEKIKPKILENLKKVYLKEDTVPLYNPEGLKGIAMNKNDTVFIDLKVMKEKNHHTGVIHELGHQAFPQKNHENQMPKWMVNLIKNALTPTEDLLVQNADANATKQIAYLQDPDEVYARIIVLREKYHFLPNQTITEENLIKVYVENDSKTPGGPKNWNVNQLLAIVRADAIVDLLNKLP